MGIKIGELNAQKECLQDKHNSTQAQDENSFMKRIQDLESDNKEFKAQIKNLSKQQNVSQEKIQELEGQITDLRGSQAGRYKSLNGGRRWT